LMTNNMDADCRRRAAEIHRQHSLAGLGSSDAHNEEVLGVCYTEFDATIRDERDLVEAIRSRKSTARERQAK
jgi:PHP-associated